jgi:hypothetical protein
MHPQFCIHYEWWFFEFIHPQQTSTTNIYNTSVRDSVYMICSKKEIYRTSVRRRSSRILYLPHIQRGILNDTLCNKMFWKSFGYLVKAIRPPMHIPCTDPMLEEWMTCGQWATGHCCHIISEWWQRLSLHLMVNL